MLQRVALDAETLVLKQQINVLRRTAAGDLPSLYGLLIIGHVDRYPRPPDFCPLILPKRISRTAEGGATPRKCIDCSRSISGPPKRKCFFELIE